MWTTHKKGRGWAAAVSKGPHIQATCRPIRARPSDAPRPRSSRVWEISAWRGKTIWPQAWAQAQNQGGRTASLKIKEKKMNKNVSCVATDVLSTSVVYTERNIGAAERRLYVHFISTSAQKNSFGKNLFTLLSVKEIFLTGFNRVSMQWAESGRRRRTWTRTPRQCSGDLMFIRRY